MFSVKLPFLSNLGSLSTAGGIGPRLPSPLTTTMQFLSDLAYALDRGKDRVGGDAEEAERARTDTLDEAEPGVG